VARSEAASSATRGVTRARTGKQSRARAAPLQAEAWSAWLLAASVGVFLTANPLYLATACLVGLVVYASLPARRRRGAYGFIVKIGLFFAVLSVPFNVLTGSSGATTLVELPRLTFPTWLGGVTFGGDATLEALLYASSRALRLVALLLFATAFNVGVDHYRLLRLVPRALRQLGVIVTVAVLLLPQAFAQARAVAEAQRLRGRRLRGLRDAGAFVVPVLAGALERSIQRAESLDARGFGGGPAKIGRTVRLPATVSVALLAGGVSAYAYDRHFALAAFVAVAASALAAMLALKARGRGVEATRYSHERLETPSALVAGLAVLSILLLAALRVLGAGDIDYFPYPAASLPEFSPAVVLALLLLLAPAFCAGARSGDGSGGRDD
jgi:energy-coupling factor transport system permease protein